MTEQDKIAVLILTKLRIIEAALGAMMVRPENQDFAKSLSQKIAALYENRELFEPMTDEEAAIASVGYRETFRAIFGEDPPAT
jgi:hypothetical protein